MKFKGVKCKSQDGDDYVEAYKQSWDNTFSALLSSIDVNGMLNNALKAAKLSLEIIRDCRLDVPATRKMALMGGKHLHKPLTFKDGDKWVVRVALQCENGSPHELLIKEMNSEIATLTVLEGASVRIAKAKSRRCIIPRGETRRQPSSSNGWMVKMLSWDRTLCRRRPGSAK